MIVTLLSIVFGPALLDGKVLPLLDFFRLDGRNLKRAELAFR